MTQPAAKRGPESQFFDAIKGRVVELCLAHEKFPIARKIVWVDLFTIGIADPDTGVEEMIYKRAIYAIRKPQKAPR